MKIWIKLLVTVCISFFFVTCSENTSEPAMTNSIIIGKVTDTNGNLLHDVDIYLIYTPVDIPAYQVEKILDPDTVSLTSFTGSVQDNGVLLNWTTATELNNQGFEIERSTSTQDWAQIGYVPGFGTTTEPRSYSYLDNNVSNGKYYFRLKQLDFNGAYEYSPEIEVLVNLTPIEFMLFQNYPNPVQGTTAIKYIVAKQTYCNLEIKNYYNSETLVVLVNQERQTGTYTNNFDNTYGLTNNIYKIYLKAVSVYITEYEDSVTMLINEDNINNIIETQPFIETVNGIFEIKLSDLPMNKTIILTGENDPTILKQQIISNLLKFVLFKDGYNVLEAEYLINLNGQNEFNFVMEKQ